MISCHDISLTFQQASGPRVIFEDMSASFDSGLFYAVTGPSGSGKTTLLNLLDRTLKPDSGTIEINGRPLNDYRREQLRGRTLTRVFQDYRLIPYLSAIDNVALAQQIAGTLKSDPSRAGDLLDRLGLHDVKDSLVQQLSGGESQRVAIARALVNSPKVIIADEPTGALDEESSTTIAELLRDLAHDYNVCTITVTHDPNVAAYADITYALHHHSLIPQ